MNTNEKMITVHDLTVNVIRKKIKNIHFTVYPPDGCVRISVPEITDDNLIRTVIISKLDWIRRHKKLFQDRLKQNTINFITGESHYYLGQRYLLEVIHSDTRSSVQLKNQKILILNVNQKTSLKQCEQILTDWYRKQMKLLLPKIINKWEIKTGLKVEAYGVKKMKTKWGSCNPNKKRIWLNLELIKKPIYCLEYVIIHEMVHFLERTHNHKFIKHMDQIMPQWRSSRDELNPCSSSS